MRVSPLCRSFLVAFPVLIHSVCAQEAKLDAKSQELITQADDALANAKTISLVQRRRLLIVQEGKEQEAGGEETSILAARPGLFRVAQEGDSAEFTVSTGTEWFRSVAALSAYQRTDVAAFAVADLFRPPQVEAMALNGRGLVSLWLGGHSLAVLLADAKAETYAGTEKVDGVELHRLDATSAQYRLSLFLAVGEPPLPSRLVLTRDIGMPGAGAGNQLRMELVFRDWKLDPVLPADAFAFTPPTGTKQVPSLDRLLAARVEAPAEEPTAARSGKPLPAGPGVVTSVTRKVAQHAAYLKLQKAQYEAYGDHDPKWDEAMLKLQAMWADRLFGNLSIWLLTDLRDQVYYIQSLGCRDAMLQYRLANFVQYLEGNAGALPLLEQAYTAFEHSSYPPICRLSVLRRHLAACRSSGQRKGEALQALSDEFADNFAQAMADPSFVGESEDILWDFAKTDWEDMTQDERKRAVEAMAALPNANPWARAYFTGRYHVTASWLVRGRGYANTVSKQGWQGFAEHMECAAKEFTTAWRLRPASPEAPCAMIEVAMAGYGGESPRVWFDRAIANQLDLDDAYTKLRWALRPRWGGSLDEIYALGLEAGKTGRFDTSAPHHFWLALLDLASEQESWQHIMARPEALETLRKVYEGYTADDAPPYYSVTYWQTTWLIGCWGAGRTKEAMEVLERLRFQPHLGACKAAWVDPDQLQAEVGLFSGPQAEPARQGLKLLAAKRYAQAVPILRQTMLALRDSDPFGYAYLGDRMCGVRFTDAPAVADQILDTMIDMHRREALVQSFIRWMAADADAVPEPFQDRVAAYLGPVSWAFLPEAPLDNTLPNEEIEAKVARIEAMTLADVPGAGNVAPEEAREQFQTEKALAKLRLRYCWKVSGNQSWGDAWTCGKRYVAPLARACCLHGLLTDFLTEHQTLRRYTYDEYVHMCLKTMSHVQEIDSWERNSNQYVAEVDRLAEIADPEVRAATAWQLYWRLGAPRVGFLIKQVLDKAGDTVQAAVMERHLLAYLAGFRAIPSINHEVAFVGATEFNSIPGYEERVIAYGEQYNGSADYLTGTKLCVADAWLRLGDLNEAIANLANSAADRATMNEWMHVADGRYRGAGESLNALILAIAQHPDITPERLDLLNRLFPDRMAQVGAQ